MCRCGVVSHTQAEGRSRRAVGQISGSVPCLQVGQFQCLGTWGLGFSREVERLTGVLEYKVILRFIINKYNKVKHLR